MKHNLVYDKQRRTVMTAPQLHWMETHPQYVFCGRPRPDVQFKDCGTLYADGRFEPMAPMQTVHLHDRCRLVGVPA